MADVDAEALKAECVRFMGASVGMRSRATMAGDGKLHEFAERAATIAAALHAVLDLHPSVEDGASPVHCAHCGAREIHPCPTVRAIAKELGVEADG